MCGFTPPPEIIEPTMHEFLGYLSPSFFNHFKSFSMIVIAVSCFKAGMTSTKFISQWRSKTRDCNENCRILPLL